MLTLLKHGENVFYPQFQMNYEWICVSILRYELEINKLSAQNLLHPIKYSITHKHTFAKANNDHAAPPLKTPKGHLIGQWM